MLVEIIPKIYHQLHNSKMLVWKIGAESRDAFLPSQRNGVRPILDVMNRSKARDSLF
jgi:hypothetical protein